MRVAAQLYTVRDFTKTDDDVCRTFERIRAIGYDAVQLSGLGAYHPPVIAKALRDNGLSVCATHTPLDRILDETDAVIEEHKLFGAPYVGLGYSRSNSIAEYAAFLDKLAPALEKLRAAGLRFLYHNHAHEFIRMDGIRPIDYMRDHTQAGVFDFLPDLFWVQTAGCSPEAFLKAYEGRTPVVHFKDKRVPPADGMTDMAEIFEGNMDYETLYGVCGSLGIAWAAVEQDVCDGDPFDSLAKSLENMKRRNMFV